jgi:hypothetical protein
MRKRNLLVAIAACALFAGSVPAQESGDATEETVMDVTAATCGELAEATEMDRAFSLMFYYGYLAGREGIAEIDGAAVPGHLEQVRDYCNANPDATVIGAFVAALGDA